MKFIGKTLLSLTVLWVATSCGDDNRTALKGRYVGNFDVGDATYQTSFLFHDSTFTKEFSFVDEDELIWRCTGTYALDGEFFLRTRRVCEFLRAEEPDLPESYTDVTSTFKEMTDTSFVLCFEKDDNSVPDTSLCVRFVRITTED